MSKENVALFIKAVNKHQELVLRMAETDKTTDWVENARGAGFEFTAEEFAAVVSDTLGRCVSAQDAVREYLMAQSTMVQGELAQRLLGSVIGQMRAAFVLCNPLFVRAGVTGPSGGDTP